MKAVDSSLVDNFDSQVKKGLEKCGVFFSKTECNGLSGEYASFGVAVSGGADSISLLTSLSHIVPRSCRLEAVTINHNIRPREETEGDADFVESYCTSIGIQCTRFDVPRGKIDMLAQERGMGIEEAARDVRYELFTQFCADKKIQFLCLAHNRNDQIETIVMRFLRGGSTGALAGIPLVRPLEDSGETKILRPLLDIPRDQIEAYLFQQKISFRTDTTNFDTAMMRNRIRNNLIPVLNAEIAGWDNAVLSLARKARDDEDAVQMLVEEGIKTIDWQKCDLDGTKQSENCASKARSVSVDAESFARLLPAVQRRILYRAIDEVGAAERAPYTMIESVCRLVKNGSDCNECAIGISFMTEQGRLYIEKKTKDATESGFFVIMKEVGSFAAGRWSVSVSTSSSKTSGDGGMVLSVRNGAVQDKLVLPGLSFPFAVRSLQPGDEVLSADGTMKGVRKIFDDWHVADRNAVPLVQKLYSTQQIVCIWGSVLGYENWVVKE